MPSGPSSPKSLNLDQKLIFFFLFLTLFKPFFFLFIYNHSSELELFAKKPTTNNPAARAPFRHFYFIIFLEFPLFIYFRIIAPTLQLHLKSNQFAFVCIYVHIYMFCVFSVYTYIYAYVFFFKIRRYIYFVINLWWWIANTISAVRFSDFNAKGGGYYITSGSRHEATSLMNIIYIYIYVCIYICKCEWVRTYVYMYIYMHTSSEGCPRFVRVCIMASINNYWVYIYMYM